MDLLLTFHDPSFLGTNKNAYNAIEKGKEQVTRELKKKILSNQVTTLPVMVV
jgi:hypothetical protein